MKRLAIVFSLTILFLVTGSFLFITISRKNVPYTVQYQNKAYSVPLAYELNQIRDTVNPSGVPKGKLVLSGGKELELSIANASTARSMGAPENDNGVILVAKFINEGFEKDSKGQYILTETMRNGEPVKLKLYTAIATQSALLVYHPIGRVIANSQRWEVTSISKIDEWITINSQAVIFLDTSRENLEKLLQSSQPEGQESMTIGPIEKMIL